MDAARTGDGSHDAHLGNEPLDIVIVDDCVDSAELAAELLECDGHRVRVAGTGRDALALLEAELPRVVLLDLELPDTDGFALAASIRARFGSALRLVAVTGSTENKPRTRAAGFDAFLGKPFYMAALRSTLYPAGSH